MEQNFLQNLSFSAILKAMKCPTCRSPILCKPRKGTFGGNYLTCGVCGFNKTGYTKEEVELLIELRKLVLESRRAKYGYGEKKLIEVNCSKCNQIIAGRTQNLGGQVCFACKQKGSHDYWLKNRDKILAYQREYQKKLKGGEEV